LQRPGGNDHQRPVPEFVGERAEEGLVDAPRSVPQHCLGSGVAGRLPPVAGEPVQGERHTLDQVLDVRQRLQVPKARAPVDKCHRVKLALEVDELHQRRLPQRSRQVRHRHRRRGLEGLITALTAPLVPDVALQDDLAPDEPGAALARPAALPDLSDHRSQLGQGPGQLRIMGRAHRPQQQMAGPALLGPLQYPAGVAVFEGHAQPKGRSLGAVAGDVSAQIDRPEAGTMLVEKPHRCADGDLRPAVVTVGAAHQGLAIPGAGT